VSCPLDNRWAHPRPGGSLDFVGVGERQRRMLSATVGGLFGAVVAGFALNALLDDPTAVWISAAVSFVAFEAVVIYLVSTRAVGQKSVLRLGAPKPRWLLRLLHIAGWFFIVLGALSFVGHVLVPDQAGTPELGAYGGWILDGVSFLLGSGALILRRRLLARGGS
jgi:hypothetical protein